jgi:hypothetical protein
MNPAGRLRCNMKSIAKGYRRVFQIFFGLHDSRFRLSGGLEDLFLWHLFAPLEAPARPGFSSFATRLGRNRCSIGHDARPAKMRRGKS